MKRQLFAIALLAASALTVCAEQMLASAQQFTISQAGNTNSTKTIEVKVDRADTSPGFVFDPGSTLEARPEMMLRVFVDGERIAQAFGPENQSSVSFNLKAGGRSTKSLVPVRVELYDKDNTTQEAIDINPLQGLTILNLRYNPATGDILNEQGNKIAQSGQFFDMEGLDPKKNATIRLSITHR